jgi:hypothetical protein
VARYAARKGAIYIGTAAAGVATNLTAMAEWSLDGTTDKIDVTSFGDANMVRLQGLPDRKGTFSGFWDDTETKLFAAAASAGAVNMYLYPDVTDKPTSYFYGPAWVDFSMNASVKDAVKVTGNFVAGGSWGSNGV